MFERWRITGWVAAGLLLTGAASGFTLGFTEDTVRLMVRISARCSLVLFLLAFSASSVHTLFPSRFSAWQLRSRRYLGVSFAASHFFHLCMLATLAVAFPEPFLGDLGRVQLIGGGLGYLFLLAQTVTSFAGPRRWLGPTRWKRLHTVGSYYLWILFAKSYGRRALVDPFYVPWALVLLVVLSLRFAAARKRKTALAAARHRTEDAAAGA